MSETELEKFIAAMYQAGWHWQNVRTERKSKWLWVHSVTGAKTAHEPACSLWLNEKCTPLVAAF